MLVDIGWRNMLFSTIFQKFASKRIDSLVLPINFDEKDQILRWILQEYFDLVVHHVSQTFYLDISFNYKNYFFEAL